MTKSTADCWNRQSSTVNLFRASARWAHWSPKRWPGLLAVAARPPSTVSHASLPSMRPNGYRPVHRPACQRESFAENVTMPKFSGDSRVDGPAHIRLIKSSLTHYGHTETMKREAQSVVLVAARDATRSFDCMSRSRRHEALYCNGYARAHEVRGRDERQSYSPEAMWCRLAIRCSCLLYVDSLARLAS